MQIRISPAICTIFLSNYKMNFWSYFFAYFVFLFITLYLTGPPLLSGSDLTLGYNCSYSSLLKMKDISIVLNAVPLFTVTSAECQPCSVFCRMWAFHRCAIWLADESSNSMPNVSPQPRTPAALDFSAVSQIYMLGGGQAISGLYLWQSLMHHGMSLVVPLVCVAVSVGKWRWERPQEDVREDSRLQKKLVVCVNPWFVHWGGGV